MLARARAIPGVIVVCFATNSARRPSSTLAGDGVRVEYLALAGKPLRTGYYRDFPRPGVVIGDQLATDGALARRLGYAFLQFQPDQSSLAEQARGPDGLGLLRLRPADAVLPRALTARAAPRRPRARVQVADRPPSTKIICPVT